MTQPPTDFVFGQTRAADYTPESSGTWIRSIRDPTTKMRIRPSEGVNADGVMLYGPDSWLTEREHYEDGIGAYVCINDHGSKDCIGCKSKSERIKKRKRNYYFEALDKDGNLRIYKVGYKIFAVLQQRHQRMIAMVPGNLQPLSDKDYFIHKAGSGLETTYDVEAGDEAYPVEWPAEHEDIPKALHDAYVECMARYSGEVPKAPSSGVTDDDDDNAKVTEREKTASGDTWATGQAKDPAAVKPDSSADRTGAAAKPAPAAAPEGSSEGALPDEPTKEQFAAADTPAIKEWMTRQEVPFPARATRTRILALAAEAADLPPF